MFLFQQYYNTQSNNRLLTNTRSSFLQTEIPIVFQRKFPNSNNMYFKESQLYINKLFFITKLSSYFSIKADKKRVSSMPALSPKLLIQRLTVSSMTTFMCILHTDQQNML